eukprot:SAG31_NODE_259_length_18917_cov_28.559677_17_plen_299_part_00
MPSPRFKERLGQCHMPTSKIRVVVGVLEADTERSNRDPALRQEHMDPGYARYIGKCVEVGMAQGHVGAAFEAAAECMHTCIVGENLPDKKRVREMEVALGALAMAKKASDLISLGALDKLVALMLDGGSMRAGAKFQAGVASWAKEGGGFHRTVIGSIPLRDGTDTHRVERVMTMFSDLLEAVKALPFFGVNKFEAATMTLQNLMKSVGMSMPVSLINLSLQATLCCATVLCKASFIGDHGESSVLHEMRKQMVAMDLGHADLKDPSAVCFFFCHLCVFINLLYFEIIVQHQQHSATQ